MSELAALYQVSEAMILAIEYRLSISQRVATIVRALEVSEGLVRAVRDAHRELFDLDAELAKSATVAEAIQVMARLRGVDVACRPSAARATLVWSMMWIMLFDKD